MDIVAYVRVGNGYYPIWQDSAAKLAGKTVVVDEVPHSFSIYILFSCNLRCSYCQWLLMDKDTFAKAPIMKLEDFNWILDRFKGDISTAGLQGGEPTMHPEFPEIVRSVKSRGLKLEMSTNGTLIAERIDDLRYVDQLNVSLNGLDYESFKKTTNGSREQFNKYINGIYLLRDSSIPFNLSFVLFEENLDEVGDVLRFAREVRPGTLNLSSGHTEGSKSLSPLKLSSPGVRNFLEELVKKEDYPFTIRLPLILDPDSPMFHEEICSRPWKKAYISPTGDISYCCYINFDSKIGNVFEGYNFNSAKMIQFRGAMLDHRFPEECLYCSRRFAHKVSGNFEPKIMKWILPVMYEEVNDESF